MKKRNILTEVGVMSNFVSHDPASWDPEFAVRQALSYLDALRTVREVSWFAYEVVSPLPASKKGMRALSDVIGRLQAQEIWVSWFIVPAPGVSPQRGVRSNRKTVNYFAQAFQLADDLGLEAISTLPAGWKDDVSLRLSEKQKREWTLGATEVFLRAAEKLATPFYIEALSGRRTGAMGALELPYFNFPSEVDPIVGALRDKGHEANHVVDWAHLLYSSTDIWHALELIDKELVPLLKKDRVGQMHLSLPRTRGNASPKAGNGVSEETCRFTKQQVSWIRAGLELLKRKNLEIPMHLWEAFQPCMFEGLLKLPETGLLPFNGPGHALDFFEAVDPTPSRP